MQHMLGPEEGIKQRLELQTVAYCHVGAGTGTPFSGRAAFSHSSEPPALEVLTELQLTDVFTSSTVIISDGRIDGKKVQINTM